MLLATRGVASSSGVSWFFIEVKSSGTLPVVKPCFNKAGLACPKLKWGSLALSSVSLLKWGLARLP